MDGTRVWLYLMKQGEKLGCHQLTERSFFFKDYQFPVCARCTGVVVSSTLAAFFFFIRPISLILAVILSLVMFMDWFLQYIKVAKSNNARRFITGLLGGYGWTTLHLSLYLFIYRVISYIVFTNSA